MKRVHVVLSGVRMRLFVYVHVCISCMYDVCLPLLCLCSCVLMVW